MKKLSHSRARLLLLVSRYSMIFVVAFAATSIGLAINAQTVSAARCFSEVRRITSEGTYSDNNTFVSQAPGSCEYQEMQRATYDVSGLPNPFPGGNDTCYYFPNDGPGQVVDCNERRFRNAPAYGQQPDNRSNVPDKTDLDDDFYISGECSSSTENCQLIQNYIAPITRALSALVGIVVVIMIVWGGIQYTSARDNPQQAAQAKTHIVNAVFALVIYIFVVAFLNWLIPGGVIT